MKKLICTFIIGLVFVVLGSIGLGFQASSFFDHTFVSFTMIVIGAVISVVSAIAMLFVSIESNC